MSRRAQLLVSFGAALALMIVAAVVTQLHSEGPSLPIAAAPGVQPQPPLDPSLREAWLARERQVRARLEEANARLLSQDRTLAEARSRLERAEGTLAAQRRSGGQDARSGRASRHGHRGRHGHGYAGRSGGDDDERDEDDD